MSLIKNIEIDTLKLRNLIVRDAQNNPVISGYTIFANGDGTTYWSSGVNAQQFINLSTTVRDIGSTLIGYESTTDIKFDELTSSVNNTLMSSIYSITTFINLVQTYSINTVYTDAALGRYAAIVASTYQTIQSSLILYNLGLDYTNNIAYIINSELAYLSISLQSTNNIIANNSEIIISSYYSELSTYTHSTFDGVFAIESTNYQILEALILANIYYTSTMFGELSTNFYYTISTIYDVPESISTAFLTLSTLISNSVSTSYAESINYTDIEINNLYTLTNQEISTVYSTINFELTSSINSLMLLNNREVSSLVSSLYVYDLQTQSTLTYFDSNITILLSTGLTQNIYQTFIDLQAFAANIIEGTTSTGNYVINSTNSALLLQNTSSYNYYLQSTFNYLTENIYSSTISTVTPYLIANIDEQIAASNEFFISTINYQVGYFNILINATYQTFVEEISTTTSQYENQISSQISYGISTQNQILSTSIILNTILVNQIVSTNVGGLNTFVYSQYKTAPSIIVNSVDNLSTLTNTAPVTGYSSLVAGLIKLDVSKYNNFYVLISDISNTVYYGLAINSCVDKINQEFTITVDIPVSQKNAFSIIDTGNLTTWLSTPKIYNPKAYDIVTPNQINIPTPTTVQQVYISSFIGAYLIDMKYTPMGMFVKNITCYPFIYSNLRLNGSVTFTSNVQTSNSLGLYSTFVYRGTPITVSWQTNDVNIPLGFKFTGTDMYGRQIADWSGPYYSGLGSANVKIPTPHAPLAQYTHIYVGVYPNGSLSNNISASNSPYTIFDSIVIPSSLYVVNPTMNTYIRVVNPGYISTYLQVTEVVINNDLGQNMTRTPTNCVYTLDTDVDDIEVFPFNGSYSAFGWQNAFDGNPTTYYYGGWTFDEVNQNATIGIHFSTISSFKDLNQPSVLISTIDIYAGPNFSLEGMQLIVSNRNEAGIADGLFYKTITLSADSVQTYSFS